MLTQGTLRAGSVLREVWSMPVCVAARVLAVFLWCWFLVALWRTQHFGFSLEAYRAALAFTCLYGLPLTCLAVVGLRQRVQVLGLAVILLGAMVAAELQASVEEYVFMQRHEGATEVVAESRWWPYASNTIGVQPGPVWFAEF